MRLGSIWQKTGKTVRKFLNDEIPEMSLVPAHATYLLWLDCRKIIVDASELCRYLRKETGLCLSAGMVYGGNGREFLRMNTACPERTASGWFGAFETGR